MEIFQDNFIKNDKHVRWVSLNKTNPFAFVFDYHFWHDEINLKLVDQIKKVIKVNLSSLSSSWSNGLEA